MLAFVSALAFHFFSAVFKLSCYERIAQSTRIHAKCIDFQGCGLVGIVMACELFPASQRTVAGAALELFWAGAWMVLALLAYLVTHWRNLQLVITMPPVITIALIW